MNKQQIRESAQQVIERLTKEADDAHAQRDYKTELARREQVAGAYKLLTHLTTRLTS